MDLAKAKVDIYMGKSLCDFRFIGESFLAPKGRVTLLNWTSIRIPISLYPILSHPHLMCPSIFRFVFTNFNLLFGYFKSAQSQIKSIN